MLFFVVHSIVFSKLKYKILHGFAWVHLTWKRCISNGLTGSCKICSIFMPRLGMNLARLCAKSCQNVMVSHGKSSQDLANFFLRDGSSMVTINTNQQPYIYYILISSTSFLYPNWMFRSLLLGHSQYVAIHGPAMHSEH